MPVSSTVPNPPSAMTYRTGRSAGQAHAALRSAIQAMDHAEHCAVLWFGEILQRRLFAELGYSSVQAYATEELGFSSHVRSRSAVSSSVGTITPTFDHAE